VGFLVVAAAVLNLTAAKDKVVLDLDFLNMSLKKAVVGVLGAVRLVLVRVSAAGVLSVLLRWPVLVVLLRRGGFLSLLPLLPLLLLVSLLAGIGRWFLVVGVVVGADLGVCRRLPLGDLPVLLPHRRQLPLLVVTLPPLSPPRRRTAHCYHRRSGRRAPPRCSRACGGCTAARGRRVLGKEG